jgi:hypothetical protein
VKSKLWIATSDIPLNKNLRYVVSEVIDLLLVVSDRTTIRRNYGQMIEAFSCLLANPNNNPEDDYSRDRCLFPACKLF